MDPKKNGLHEAIVQIQDALMEWDRISATAEDEAEQFREKTRALLKKLSEELKALE